jgi:hypothetical protein
MPRYTPSEDEMDSSYGGGPAKPPPLERPGGPPPKRPAREPESVDEENAGATEILVAKSKLPPGVREGDEVTFRVSGDYGEEVSLVQVKEEPGEEPEAETETETEEPTGAEDEELSALPPEE